MHIFPNHIMDVADFPKPGVMFRDISPLLLEKFPEAVEQLAALLDEDRWNRLEVIAGIDARGFIFASALAMLKRKKLIMVRKKEKLPPPVIGLDYQLEYGQDRLEVKAGHGRVVIVDDVLATGGTLHAAGTLCQKAGYTVSGFMTLIDLKYLNQFAWQEMSCLSLIHYHE